MLYIAEVYYPLIIRAIFNPIVLLSKAGDVKFYAPQEIQANFETQGFGQVGFKKRDISRLLKCESYKVHQ